MSDFQKGEPIDFTRLLEEIEKIDDLDTLYDFENMLVSEKQNKTQAINRICHQNAQMTDELNTAKCLVQELDELHNDELQMMDNLRENIRIKQLEAFQEQDQQVADLDQFELEVSEITRKFVTAPKEYENNYMNEKICNIEKVLDAIIVVLQQQKEKEAKTQDEFEEPIEIALMDLPLSIFDNATTEITSSNKNLDQSSEKISKEVDNIRFNMTTKNITKQLHFYKN